ncbi:MAG TPA: M23 family metallopeptidase [Anaerolineae bacterium]
MKRFILAFASLSLFMLLAAQPPALARNGSGIPLNPKPFHLPFLDPPGPGTWLLGQPYGNTTGAYRQRKTTYGQGQGIHFGIDLLAACKTPALALADGTVVGVDGPFGSAPHNLMILFPNGYAALYGHLYERPRLQLGQPVKAGQFVALTGDPDETCYSRPHLHLEIRDSTFARAYNPIDFIDADWENLMVVSAVGRGFEKDLDSPRQWQYADDQPEIHFGFPLVNDFVHPWPPSQGTDR